MNCTYSPWWRSDVVQCPGSLSSDQTRLCRKSCTRVKVVIGRMLECHDFWSPPFDSPRRWTGASASFPTVIAPLLCDLWWRRGNRTSADSDSFNEPEPRRYSNAMYWVVRCIACLNLVFRGGFCHNSFAAHSPSLPGHLSGRRAVTSLLISFYKPPGCSWRCERSFGWQDISFHQLGFGLKLRPQPHLVAGQRAHRTHRRELVFNLMFFEVLINNYL